MVIKISSVVLITAALSSCSRRSEGSGEEQARAYLKPLLHIGESKTNIIATFGDPIQQHETQIHEWRMDFLFSDTNREAIAAGVGGVTVFFTNNQVSDWIPI